MEREKLFRLVLLMLLPLNEMVRTIMMIPARRSNPVLFRIESVQFHESSVTISCTVSGFGDISSTSNLYTTSVEGSSFTGLSWA